MKIAERQELLARVSSEITKAEEQIAIDREAGERLRAEYDAAVAEGKHVDAVGFLTAANYHNGHSTALREAQAKFKGFHKFIESARLDDIPVQAVLPEVDSTLSIQGVATEPDPADFRHPEPEIERDPEGPMPFGCEPITLIRRKKAAKPIKRGKASARKAR